MKKIFALLTALVLVFNIVIPVAAEMGDEFISVQNGIIEYKINKANGRFTVNTTDGIPEKPTDNDKNLLFFDRTPDTSFTTIRIDGKEYVFGNSYPNGGIVMFPTQSGNTTTTVWKIDNIEITQKIQLVTDESNPNAGNTKITYTSTSTDNVPHTIEARVLLDTQLGSNDASPMIVGTSYITNETEFVGENVPTAWKSADERYAPAIIAYGLNHGWDNNAPTRMIVAHWENLSATKWDYTPDTYLNFTSYKNKFDSADSSVALYYEDYVLDPGKELVFETFYGIGSLVDAAGNADFTVQINAPSKLTINDSYTAYNEETIDIIVTIDNTHEDAYDLNNVVVDLGMDPQLVLAENQESAVIINKIQAGDKLETVFKVVPLVQNTLAVAEVGVTVLYGEGERSYAEARKYVVLPSIKGIPPKMQMTEVSPEVTYTETLKKTFLIKGSDFDSLKADYEWEMYIESELTGEKYPIKRKDITITNEALSLMVDKDYKFTAGQHKIVLASSSYGNMSKAITFTDDKKFNRKEFGYALVGGFEEDKDGNVVYSVITVDSEKEITAEQKDATLLKLKGEIFVRETDDGIIYECGPGTIINDSILYRAPANEPHKCFTIKRYTEGGVNWWGLVEDSVVVSGTGYLAIGDYTFHYGDFYVTFNDGTDYELTEATYEEDDDDYNWDNPMGEEEANPVEIITPTGVVAQEVLKTVGMLSGTKINIKNVIIGKNTISLGGSIGVALPWMSKAADGGGDDDDKNTNDSNDKKSSDKSKAEKPSNGKESTLKDKHDKLDSYNAIEDGQKTDDIISIDLDELRYGVKSNNSSYLVGLRAEGAINLTDDSIPKLEAGGFSAGLALNSIDYDGMYANISAGFKVGDAFEAEGEVALVFETGGSCIPDSVKLVMGGEVMKIPLGIVGFLTKLGGGVYNLYDTIKGYYNVIPPVTFNFITGYEDPTTVAFEMDTISMELGLNGFKYEGDTGKIVGLKIIDSVYGKFLVYVIKNEDGSYSPCLDLGVGMEMNVMGILKGGANVWLVYDPRVESIFGNLSLGGKGYVGVFIPDYVPLVGGKELLGAAAELSTHRVFLGIKIIGIPVSVGYYWTDKKVRFNDDFSTMSLETGVPVNELENAYILEDVQSTENASGFMTFGSNIKQTYSSKDSMSLMSDNKVHTIPVNNQDYALFEVQYYNELPEIKVTKPDGTAYELIENENMLMQTIGADVSDSGIVEKRVYISVTEPMDGNWTISADSAIDVIGNDVLGLPELKDVNCTQNKDEVTVSWNAKNIDDSYLVDLYIAERQEQTYDIADFKGREEEYYALMSNQDLGINVAKDIPANKGSAVAKISDLIKKGDFCARVVLHKDGESYDSELSQSYFTYKHPNIPEKPSNVQITNGGDGQFKVTFDKVDNAQKYSVNLLNADGTPIEGYEGVITEDTSAYIGSIMSIPTRYDEQMNPVSFTETGAFPGKEYKIKVYAYNEIDNILYASDEYISDTVYLKVPNPAKASIKINGKTAPEETNENGENVVNAVTNIENAVVEYSADQKVYVSYKMDGIGDSTVYELEAGEALTIPTTLLEGGSIMEFAAVNDDGDSTITKVNISFDCTPPELLLNQVNVTSTNGAYTITGTAETNAVVYIKGTNTVVPVINGVFAYNGTLAKSREDVTFTAIDAAGNETSMTACVVDGGISSFKRIIAKDENGNEIETLKLNRGDSSKIRIYGVDETGAQYELSDANIEYEVVYGNDKATVDENGEITGEYYGDAVVLCSYYVTENYSFEASVEVLVEQSLESAKDIRISTTDVHTTEIGSIVARLSVPDAPIAATYTYTIEENDYFDVADNIVILKKELDVDSTDITITAVGKHVVDGVYADIGEPFTKTITLNRVKRIVSINNPSGTRALVGVDFEKLDLPINVTALLNDNTEAELPVTWNKGAYNPTIKNVYTLKGNPELPAGIINPENLVAEMTVTVYRPGTKEVQEKTYTIDISHSEGGTVSTVDNNKSVKVICTPDVGYEVESMLIDGKNVGNMTEYEIATLKKDISIFVTFKKIADSKNPFIDVTADDWFMESVLTANAKGLMMGTSENTFEPNAPVTRAMFVTVLYRMEGSPDVVADTSFTDVESNSWYEKAVAWASKARITNGVSADEFAPDMQISREQMATLVYRYLEYKNALLANTSAAELDFADKAEISPFAVNAIKYCRDIGIINGVGDNLLAPQGISSRAQAATIFVRLLEKLN